MRLNIVILNLVIFVLVAFPVTGFTENIINKTSDEYHRLGVEAQEREDQNAALAYYNKALSLGRENPIVINDLAILYEKFGVDALSEQLYLDAIRVDHTYLPPYINLAYLYLKHRNIEKAARYFRQRYELSLENDPWAQKALEELLKIKPAYMQGILKAEVERFKKEIVELEAEKLKREIIETEVGKLKKKVIETEVERLKKEIIELEAEKLKREIIEVEVERLKKEIIKLEAEKLKREIIEMKAEKLKKEIIEREREKIFAKSCAFKDSFFQRKKILQSR